MPAQALPAPSTPVPEIAMVRAAGPFQGDSALGLSVFCSELSGIEERGRVSTLLLSPQDCSRALVHPISNGG